MKTLSIALLALALSGCAASNVAERLLSRDLDAALTMARSYGTEQEARCFEGLKAVLDKQAEAEKAETAGLVSQVYKTWVMRHYGEKARQGAAQACLPVAAGIGLHVMTR